MALHSDFIAIQIIEIAAHIFSGRKKNVCLKTCEQLN
jgi:hypothetical protein